MVRELIRLDLSFINVLETGRMFQRGSRAGTDPLTVWHIKCVETEVGEHGCDRPWASGTVVSRDEASGKALDSF